MCRVIFHSRISLVKNMAVTGWVAKAHHDAAALSVVFGVEGLLSEFLEWNVAANAILAHDIADLDVEVVAERFRRSGRLLLVE